MAPRRVSFKTPARSAVSPGPIRVPLSPNPNLNEQKENVVRTLKEMIVNNQKVRFSFYRDGQLWYETECGFRFPVPISEAGTATFLVEDRAILFMRYIRN